MQRAFADRFSLRGALALLLIFSCGASAETVEFPLLVESRFVQHAVAQVLELDAAGRGQIIADECNHLELHDLVVKTVEGEVVVSLATRAVTGAYAFGQCRGPRPWKGRMNVEMLPSVDAAGAAVRFAPVGAELVRADGSAGVLTGPTRSLAENLVLPRMEGVRVDLAESLAAVDRLLESVLPDYDPGHAEGARIRAVEVTEPGLSLLLGLDIGVASEAPMRRAEPPLSREELAQWQRLEDELDGFLTTVITELVTATADADLRLELLAVLLDARHAIAEAFVEDVDDVEGVEAGEVVAQDSRSVRAAPTEQDPVRRIFIESWDRLRPWLADLALADAPDLEAEMRLAAFTAGGDALRALDALGPQLGLEISADGLRRMARLLLADKAPESFTPLSLEVDPAFRSLFGLDRLESRTSRARTSEMQRRLHVMLDFFLSAAAAEEESPAEALRGVVPRLATLDDYLQLVASLLEQQTSEHIAAGTKVPAHLKPRFDPLVWATAWKESCWRQFIGSTENPRVLKSPVGALGMMQVSGRVWRGTYDPKRLAEDVDYNVTAGTEILEHYLVDYAIRRGEHKHPGGDDNLIRATYAAYNGGPSQMGRYRRANTPARLRAIDNDFWRHYQTMKSHQWPEVSSCYAVGD